MIIARWKIDARFGHKQEVINSINRWNDDIGSQLGWTHDKVRMATGSIGLTESTVVMEVELDNLEELQKAWDKLGQMDAHKRWGKELEPNIVSGSNRWEVLRVL